MDMGKENEQHNGRNILWTGPETILWNKVFKYFLSKKKKKSYQIFIIDRYTIQKHLGE